MAESPGPATLPLDGVRVIELATVVSGPFAGLQLVQLGADVIKVEPPEGDETRRFGPFHNGESAFFWNLNRGKRSVVADLKSAADRDAVEDLCVEADVVIENWRPGVAARLRLDHANLRVRNARLITVSIRGFGDTGPYADDRVYDPIVQAVSGLAAYQGKPDQPELVKTILPDKVAGLAATQGVLGALVQRGRTGEGSHVEVSMLDALLSFLFPDMFLRRTFIDGPPLRSGAPRSAIIQRCAGDQWVIATTITTEQFASLAALVGRPDLADRYPDMTSRLKARHEINDILTPWFGARKQADVLSALHAAEVPAAAVNTIDEVLTDPQVQHNGVLTEIDRGALGRVREVMPLVRIDGGEHVPLAPAPALGTHTEEMLGRVKSRVR
jgi:crotonobetainyl-CoA:carnitine CoA-transferase CaiB-like acyl-CoA transferase